MKSTDKTRKQKATDSGTARRCCGTLDYIAECRGGGKKAPAPGRQGHIDVISRIELKP